MPKTRYAKMPTEADEVADEGPEKDDQIAIRRTQVKFRSNLHQQQRRKKHLDAYLANCLAMLRTEEAEFCCDAAVRNDKQYR
tara:strand:+ start:9549 stop:9794 length:246 start_codon:yes stop_codon:yes gene_type:complete